MQGFKVNAVDTTAAGDSFNGGFAFSLSMDNDIETSVQFANAVAAISTISLGA
jgi:ribokinase